jgi:hypothetical protein
MKMLYVFLITLLFAVACSDSEPQPLDSSGKSASTGPCGEWVLTPYKALYWRRCENSLGQGWDQYKRAGQPDPSSTSGALGTLCTCSAWDDQNYQIGVLSKICVKVSGRVTSWSSTIYRPSGGPSDETLYLDDNWICSHWN